MGRDGQQAHCKCRGFFRPKYCPVHGKDRKLPALPPSRADQCKHDHLHFENGGFYIVCSHCGDAWTAVGHCPARTMHNFAAMSHGLSPSDKRSNPLAKPETYLRPEPTPRPKASDKPDSL